MSSLNLNLNNPQNQLVFPFWEDEFDEVKLAEDGLVDVGIVPEPDLVDVAESLNDEFDDLTDEDAVAMLEGILEFNFRILSEAPMGSKAFRFEASWALHGIGDWERIPGIPSPGTWAQGLRNALPEDRWEAILEMADPAILKDESYYQ